MTAHARIAEASHAPGPKLAQILVLGGGAVVQECFLPALEQLQLVAKTTVVDLRPATLNGPAVGPRTVQGDFRDFIRQIDSQQYSHCVVALPNAYHFEAVREALRNGLHVLCEKPLALQSRACLELAAVADEQRRVLAVNMVRRLLGSVQTASEILRRGWLGELQAVHISHGGAYSWPVASLAPFQPENGGVLADMGVHYLDLAELFAGSLTPVEYEDDHAGGVESECRFTLQSDSGALVKISLSRVRRLANQIRLVGSLGTVTIDVDQFDTCVFEPRGGAAEQQLLISPKLRGRSFADHFGEQMRRFLGAEAGAEQGLVNARQAARVIQQIEWAYARRCSAKHSVSSGGGRTLAGRVLVTGATGFIGSHLVDRLNRDGQAEIVASYRRLDSCAAISRYSVQYHKTDLANPEDIRRALRGSRYVFHLAYGRESHDARAVTVAGTKNVVEAAIAEGLEAVVVLSTMYVLGHPGGVVDETCGYQPIGGMYGTTKAEMERWCLERAKHSGKTRIVVLLPTCVYGPRGRAYTEMPAALAREGSFCWIEDGRGIANVTYVENLVDAMILAALHAGAHGQRFIINDECLSWREFLSPLVEPWLKSVSSYSVEGLHRAQAGVKSADLGDVLRSVLSSPEVSQTIKRTWLANRLRPVITKRAPSLAAKLRRPAACPGLPSRESLHSPPPVWLADLFAPTNTRFSSEKARTELGWAPSVERDVAIRQTIEWLERMGLR